MVKNNFTFSILLSIGLILAGVSIGYGFYKGRAVDRFVTVKGLAEKEVDADLVFWPITFGASAQRVEDLDEPMALKREITEQFLIKAGFDQNELIFSPVSIRENPRPRDTTKETTEYIKYSTNQTITTRSSKVALVRATIKRTPELAREGVIPKADPWYARTEYLFVGLNEVKPGMIEEATKNARLAAEKFAHDSGSRVGKIRHATQGYFEVTDRDRLSPEKKKVRVVTTVEFYLVD